MSVAIRIDECLYEQARRAAKAEHRTAPLQVSYWATIGRVALDNPDLPIEFIRDVMVSKNTEESEPFVFEE